MHCICTLKFDKFIIGTGAVAQFFVIARALKKALNDRKLPLNASAADKSAVIVKNLPWAVALHVPAEDHVLRTTARVVEQARIDGVLDEYAVEAAAQAGNISAEDLHDCLCMLRALSAEDSAHLFAEAFGALKQRRQDIWQAEPDSYRLQNNQTTQEMEEKVALMPNEELHGAALPASAGLDLSPSRAAKSSRPLESIMPAALSLSCASDMMTASENPNNNAMVLPEEVALSTSKTRL